MNKLVVCLTMAALAAMTSLQAGEQCCKEKTPVSASACSSSKPVSASACTAAKPVSASACSASQKVSASACQEAKTIAASPSCCASAKAKMAKRNANVKGAGLLVQR